MTGSPRASLLLSGLMALLLGACATPSGGPRTGVEVQAYPAGVIPGAHVRWRPTERDAVFLRVAANVTERSDFGEHDDESGSGFGGGVGWRRAHGESLDADGWHYGARLDVWDLEVDWEDPGPREGTSDVLVLQPTAELGYGWTTESGRFELTAGLGAEINVDTDGEDVGEGAILLIGLTWVP